MSDRVRLGHVGRGFRADGALRNAARPPRPGSAARGSAGIAQSPMSCDGRIRSLRALVRDRDGAALVEFTLVVTLLVTILIAIMQFGLMLNGYIVLNGATQAGARRFALARGVNTPYTDARTQIFNSAPNLKQGQLSITLAVNGTTCANDSACKTALQSAAGLPITVSTTYPCSSLTIIPGFALGQTCTVRSSMSARVE